MSDQDNLPNEYSELRSMFKYHIDVYVALYQLKTENEEDLNSIYKMIKTNLIDSKKCSPQNIIERISKIIPHNNRYIKSYLTLMKLITDGYNLTEVRDIPITWAFLFYKEYGIKLDKYANFEEMNLQNIDIHSENTIYRAIMNNDLETFIFITEKEGFDKNQQLQSSLYPESEEGYSLLELCCYHGAVDCFKLLRTKFNSEITEQCLWFSFLGGNQDIMSECLKYQEPDYECMEYTIISHNIDFVTFLMNEYDIDINISDCAEYNNLESFLVYFDQTNEVNQCFIYSALFDNPSLCEYFLSLGANVNEKNIYGATALDNAVRNNSKKTAEFLITHGATINTPGKYSVLHVAAIKNSKETAEILISHGADIDGIDENYNTPLIYAANKNNSEIVELLISHGANVNKKDEYGFTSLHFTARENNAKMAQLLISHGAKPNKKMTAEKPLFILQQLIIVKKQLNFLFHMVQISMKKIIMDEPLFILQPCIIVKRQLNFLFHLVQISMKKIILDKLLFILQPLKIIKKQLNFLFHMVQISMKKIKRRKPLFILQPCIIVKRQLNFLFHLVQISMKKIILDKPLFILQP
ncbi:hypothetical protein TVAG_004730 [Trichomonas vaginalis G3]|uniref:DUF3447 domain-containing protein n=1 Tax=Trichomonas vaginalis (strain ATCC PRA-98 / G3) TaxID=412133 RepID=A2DT35_TRIV3|nr:spectrin binding [Trichomonas vaginalis G3]EAY16442.1 hypothetical protein TVAG_004730 [Trichomonas vaginalis G3]KAI5505692.1 spectrin binding [Trichomonas vaginalis G3]|eukprot:XP_001328665.1 hypothetical protein [Trichomonas vaginalis G3]